MAATTAAPDERDWSWSIGVQSFNRQDPDAVIGSPRSLEVLACEGVAPNELIYKPLHLFEQDGLDPEVAKMRHDFVDARRQDLISAALAQMCKAETGTSDDAGVPGARLFGPSLPDWPQTVAFFKLWQSKLDRHTTLDEQGQRRETVPLRRNSEPHLQDTEPTSLDGTATLSPARIARAKSRSSPSGELHTSLSQPALSDTLSLMRAVPHLGRADEEMARKTEELLLTQRQSELRRLSLAHAEEEKSAKAKAEIARRGLERANTVDNKNKQLRQLREEQASKNENEATRVQRAYRDLVFSPNGTQLLASPKGSTLMSTLRTSLGSTQGAATDDELLLSCFDDVPSPGTKSSKVWSERAHEKSLSMRDAEEFRRNAVSVQHTQTLQQRKEKALSQSFAQNEFTAQRNLENRIRFKYTHSGVLRQQEEMKTAQLRAWQRTEARLSQDQERSENMDALRRELKDLRRTQRLLSERQQRRKLRYQKLRPEAGVAGGTLSTPEASMDNITQQLL